MHKRSVIYTGFWGLWYIIRCHTQQYHSAWWRHQMETFSALLAFCEGNHLSPVYSPPKGQWRGALMFSLICAWTNGWANAQVANDLSRLWAHYDVNVMDKACMTLFGIRIFLIISTTFTGCHVAAHRSQNIPDVVYNEGTLASYYRTGHLPVSTNTRPCTTI